MTRIYSGFKIFGLKIFFNWKCINFGPIYSCPKLKLKCLGLLLSVTKSHKWAKSSVFMSIPMFLRVSQVILWLSATASVYIGSLHFTWFFGSFPKKIHVKQCISNKFSSSFLRIYCHKLLSKNNNLPMSSTIFRTLGLLKLSSQLSVCRDAF